MLNEVVKGLKRTKTDWLSPNLSEPVRAVRTAEESAPIKGSIGTILRWRNKQTLSGVFTVNDTGNSFPSAANENAEGVIINLNFGGGQPHQNMQPAVACYSWFRTE